MSTELIINATLPETRIALLENNEIQELHIERDSERGIVGNIYKGKVIRVLPGMQAAFVDIGLEKAAFLYVDDIFFPDMKTPLQTNPLPEPVPGQPAAAPRPDRGRGRGRGREGAAPAGEAGAAAPLPGSPEAHAAAQAEYARQVQGEDVAGGSGAEAAAPVSAPAEAAPAVSPVGAEASPREGLAEQPVARAPEAPAAEEEEEDTEIESQAVYRPEPLIDAAAWQEDLTAEADEEEAPEAVAEGEAPATAEAQVETAAPEATAESAASAESASPVAAATTTVVVAKAPAVVPPVRPVGVDEDDEEEDEETSEMPRRRRRREPVNIADIIREGQEILVQVAKDPIGTKGARLTCHVSLPGRYLVFMPTVDHIGVSRRIEGEGERRRLKETMGRIRPSKTGVIVRTASGKQTDRKLKQDLDYLVTTWNDIQKKFNKQRAGTTVYQDLTIVLRAIRDMFTDEVDKVIVDSKREHKAIMKFVTRFIPQVKDKVELYEGDMPIFDMYGIETEISRALERKVWLKSGGYLVIDQAEALVAIDVNTGRYVGKKTLEETILKTNLEAVKEIAYQLRLRNCGGIIILDLIDMEKEANKEKVYKALEEALKRDRARPSILKISQLGLIEMTRKRTRDSMVRSLCEPCANCEGKGFVKNKLTLAYDIMRDIEREIGSKDNLSLSIQCHPSVADVLLEDKRDVLEDLEHQYDKKLTVRGNGAYHVEQYELIAQRETKNVVWSSEERRQILRQRIQERTQKLVAEGRKQAEIERQERRRQEEERRVEQEKLRAERRAQAEERRRQAAAVREAARVAAFAAAQTAAEDQVRAKLIEQGLSTESPEWAEQFDAGVVAIMAVFQAQHQAAEPRQEPEPREGAGAGGEGEGEFRGGGRGRRRRRGRRGRGGGRGHERQSGGSGGGGGGAPHAPRPHGDQPVTASSSPEGAMPSGGGESGGSEAPTPQGGPGGTPGGPQQQGGDPQQRRRRRRGRRGGRWRRRPGQGGGAGGGANASSSGSGGSGASGSDAPAPAISVAPAGTRGHNGGSEG